jgi:hypothetical protein
MNATIAAASPVPSRAASTEATDVPTVGGADFGVLVALLQQLIATRPAGVVTLDVPASGPLPVADDAPLLAAVGRGVGPTSRGSLGGEALVLEASGDDADARKNEHDDARDDARATIAGLAAPTLVPVVAGASPTLVVARATPLVTNVLEGPWPSHVEASDPAEAPSLAATLPRSSNGADRAVLPRGDVPATFAASFEPRVDAAAAAPAHTENGTLASPTPLTPPLTPDATARPKDGVSVDAPRGAGGAPARTRGAPPIAAVPSAAAAAPAHTENGTPGSPTPLTSPPAPDATARPKDGVSVDAPRGAGGAPARTRGAPPIAAVPSGLPGVRSESMLPRTDAEELTDGVSAGRPRLARDTAADVQASGEGIGVAGEAPVTTSRATPSRDVESGPVEIARHPIEQVATRLREIRPGDRREIFLRLDPPDLGVVRIEARLDGTRLSVQIHTEQASTRELLAEAIPRLRESLSQQGFVPDQISVHLGLGGSGHQPDHDRTSLIPEPVAGGPPARPRPASASDPIPAASAGLDLWA